MPKIVIWMPRNENEAGHVAIATNEYYVSFWPARCLEKGKVTRTISNGIEFAFEVHKGRFVFNQDFDKIDEDDPNEGGCDPDCEHEIDAAKVSNEDVNAVIEEFLRYNGIDPEDVTLAKGEEKYREYKELVASLTQDIAERIKDDQKPVKSLAKTEYSIMAELVSRKKDDNLVPFYKSHQSCVSLAFNLVQTAWLKHHPNPIPIVNYEEAKSSSEFSMTGCVVTVGANSFLTGKIPKELAYKVPWFEKEVVRRYLITDELNNQPIISVPLEIEKALRRLKPMFVSTFVLLLIGYFFPETRYPNLFIFSNFVSEDEVIDDPSILHHFIVPLFIILLAHHNWCGVFLSVVIFHGGDFSYDIMKSYLSGEFWGKLNRFLVEAISVARKIAVEFDELVRVVLGRKPKSKVELLRLYIDFLRRAHTK